MTIEKLQQKDYQSVLRNKLIAEAFYLTGNIEKYGSDFIRIENELKNYPQNSYEFKEIANAMQITFFKELDEGTTVGVNVGVNELHKFISEHQPVKIYQLTEHFNNVTQRTIERWLKQLKEENKIEFKGAFKTGGYYEKN